MKKWIIWLLVLSFALALTGCGGSAPEAVEEKAPEAGTVLEELPEPTEEVPEEPVDEGPVAEPVKLGNTISLPFASMTLESFELSDGYSFSHTEGILTRTVSIDCPSGMKLVVLRGTFTNKAKSEVFPSNKPADGLFVINGYEYPVTFRCYNTAEAESLMSVVPLQSADYFFYTEIPASLANSIETCQVYIGFVENLDSSVWVMSVDDLDYLYLLEAMPSK